jgi:glycosyltransferase involved in cell wall biosynthesis
MRILIFHPLLWIHYKAKIYSEFQKIANQNPQTEVLVAQVAVNEKSRANMGALNLDIHQYNYKLLFDGFIEDVSFWNRFRASLQTVRKFKPDVVNFCGYFDNALNLVMLYCWLRGIKIIISNDSTEGDHKRVFWKEFIKKSTLQFADGFFNYGTKSAEYMLKLGMAANKMLVNRNAVDNDTIARVYAESIPTREQEKAKWGLRKYNFIFVGRILPLKNLTRVLEAFHQVNHPDWGLIIVGNGEDEDNLKKYIADNQVSGVTFMLPQPWDSVPRAMALADVLILASYSETWGLVVNEAMICQMPVLVSDKCGSAYDLVKEGQNGYTFSPYSVEELIEKMQLICPKTDEDLKQMGEKSKEIIQQFSPQNVAFEMYEGFKKVLK